MERRRHYFRHPHLLASAVAAAAFAAWGVWPGGDCRRWGAAWAGPSPRRLPAGVATPRLQVRRAADGYDRGPVEALQTVKSLEGRSFPSGIVPAFATPIYRRRLFEDADDTALLNEQILAEVRRLRDADDEGKTWSEDHYGGDYTSFGSERSLNRMSPTFERLEFAINGHVRRFCSQPEMDGAPRDLYMRDCWVNILARQGSTHGLHHHGAATVSGTYYAQTPRGSSGISFEDPRVDRMLATKRRGLVEFPVRAGDVVLFESWVRHTVTPNRRSPEQADAPGAEDERVSISFNYVPM